MASRRVAHKLTRCCGPNYDLPARPSTYKVFLHMRTGEPRGDFRESTTFRVSALICRFLNIACLIPALQFTMEHQGFHALVGLKPSYMVRKWKQWPCGNDLSRLRELLRTYSIPICQPIWPCLNANIQLVGSRRLHRVHNRKPRGFSVSNMQSNTIKAIE